MQVLNLYNSFGINNVKYNSYFNNTCYIKFGNTEIPQKYLNIKKFRNVDNILYRGGKPSLEKIQLLKKIGIDTIIDFTTENDLLDGINYEKIVAENMGITYINLPLGPNQNPNNEYINKFFEIMEQARKDNKKVYIHCKRGQDRTGLFTAMYKLKYNLANLDTCIQEMIDMGHCSTANPTLLPFLKDFYYSILPNLNHNPTNIINQGIIKMS